MDVAFTEERKKTHKQTTWARKIQNRKNRREKKMSKKQQRQHENCDEKRTYIKQTHTLNHMSIEILQKSR